MHETASPKTQADLTHALGDVRDFCNAHPEQAAELIKKLEARDLIGQLSVAALQEATKQHPGMDNLTREDAMHLFDGQGALGKAFQSHVNQAFSVTPDASHYGHGYADAGRAADGRIYTGTANQGDTPILTTRHINELMGRFDHGPTYKGESQVKEEGPVERMLGKIGDFFGF